MRPGTSRRPSAAFVLAVVAVALVGVAFLAWRAAQPGPPLIPTVIPPLPSASVEVLVAAGDIAECGDRDDEATADLVERIRGTVLTLGDNAYPDGSVRDHRECYGPSWGRFRDRTRPVAGNHEYETEGAAGHHEYWATGGDPGDTWYAFDVGEWRVIVLDSNCRAIGGCGADSPQGRWLAAELAESDARCTLAAWHHPRFSSGAHGDSEAVASFWEQLHPAGVELVLNGHDHDYERFAPQRPDGVRDDTGGIRQFVVGTGGGHLRGFDDIRPNSEVRDNRTYGVLRLALDADGYAWDFVPITGRTFTDRGTGTCH
jgi:hypothetical protein